MKVTTKRIEKTREIAGQISTTVIFEITDKATKALMASEGLSTKGNLCSFRSWAPYILQSSLVELFEKMRYQGCPKTQPTNEFWDKPDMCLQTGRTRVRQWEEECDLVSGSSEERILEHIASVNQTKDPYGVMVIKHLEGIA